ncbi:ankyrin repeat-containing domain protein [Trichoderma sp. SZMC 28015]
MTNGKRILCLDGGGVKGLTSLCILKEIMTEIRVQEQGIEPGYSQPDSQLPLKPCDYFDLICGTSTGGLIALLLGRLEYTVDDAIKAYMKLGRRIFGKKLPWLTRWDATYDHKILEDCLKEVIRESPLKLGEDEPLKDDLHHCKTFVVSTILNRHSTTPAILRSYDVKGRELAEAFSGKIWEAGRATSAAPTFFKPIVIGDYSYSDGATIANNPSHHAIMEAGRIWALTDIDCIISLGTGPEGDHTLDNATLEILGRKGMWLCKKMVSRSLYYRLQLAFYSLHSMTGTEYAHNKTKEMVEIFREKHLKEADAADATNEVYFRLNVTDMKAKVQLDAWSEMESLKDLASHYIKTIASDARKAIAKKLARDNTKRLTPPQSRDYQYLVKLTVLVDEPVSKKEVQALIDTSAENNFISSELVSGLGILPRRVMDHEKPLFRISSDRLIRPESAVQLVFIKEGSSHIFENSFFVLDKEYLPEDMIVGSKLVLGDNGHIMLEPTPLSLAAGHGHEAIVRLLIESGADIESKDKEGFTPLMFAVESGHRTIVERLLTKGADTESEDKHNFTPLMLAIMKQNEEMVKLLLKHGANPNSAEMSGFTPLMYAVGKESADVIKLLLEYGANINLADESGYTPLMRAVGEESEDIIKLLLEYGANINLADENGTTSLMRAVGKESEDIIRLLLENGANTNLADENGTTPLMRAIGKEREDIVELLLKYGADTNLADKSGATSLMRAVSKENEGIVELLLRYGAT